MTTKRNKPSKSADSRLRERRAKKPEAPRQSFTAGVAATIGAFLEGDPKDIVVRFNSEEVTRWSARQVAELEIVHSGSITLPEVSTSQAKRVLEARDALIKEKHAEIGALHNGERVEGTENFLWQSRGSSRTDETSGRSFRINRTLCVRFGTGVPLDDVEDAKVG